MIINIKVVVKKLLGLADLTKTRVFHIYKSLKVVIVSENKNLIFVTF